MDMVDSATCDDGPFESKVGEAGMVGAWDFVQRALQGMLEVELSGTLVMPALGH